MGLFLAVLYIHVVATLGLVAGMGGEAVGVGQLRVNRIPWMRIATSLCLAILFLSGGYLTEHAGLWKLAWPKIAVVMIVAFGALSGLASRRERFLRTSLAMRARLVLGAVWLMTAKPYLAVSLAVGLASIVIPLGFVAASRR